MCGFEDDDDGKYEEGNILECGTLGSTRAQAKYYHLQSCGKAKELGLDKKYNKLGHEVGNESNANAANMSSSSSNSNRSNPNASNSNSNRNGAKFGLFLFCFCLCCARLLVCR